MSLATHPNDIDLRSVLKDRLVKPKVTPPFAKPQPPQPNPKAELGKGKPAARITDKFAHSSALATMLKFMAIAVAAVVVAAVATVLIVGTGGLAAGPMLMMVGGGLAAVGGAGKAGMSAGSKKMGPPTGAILIPIVNTNVKTNSLLNACATSSQGACAKDPGPPIPVAMGSDSVFIHSLGAAREGDKMACGAAIIAKCSKDVLIGGGAQPYMDIQSEVPEWVVNTLDIMVIGGLVMTGAGAITVLTAAFVGGGLTAGLVATGEMALTVGGGMAAQHGGKYAGGQIALAQGYSKDSYEYESYQFYGETLAGVTFDIGSTKGMETEAYKGKVDNIKAKAADPNTKLGKIEAAANAKGNSLKKGMTGAVAGAVMHVNVMTANLSPPPAKPPSHYEAPIPPMKAADVVTPKLSGNGDGAGAGTSRTKYEVDTGVFTGKGIEGSSGPLPDKPTITVHIEANHPSKLIRQNDFDSVVKPKAANSNSKPSDGAKPKNMDTFDFGKHLKGLSGQPPKDMPDPHAHHILFKKGLGAKQQALVKEGQAILRKHDIDPIYGKENLTWAPNRVKDQHSITSLKPLVDDLKMLDSLGASREQIVDILSQYGQIAAQRR